MESNLFFWRNPFASSNPKKYEHPRTSLSFCNYDNAPLELSIGSAHIKSQKIPFLGIYLNLSTFLILSS
jgi:hypothetical protein